MEMIYVEFDNLCNQENIGWVDIKSVEVSYKEVKACGLIIDEDDEQVIIAQHVNEDGKVIHPCAIPKPIIKKEKRVVVADFGEEVEDD